MTENEAENPENKNDKKQGHKPDHIHERRHFGYTVGIGLLFALGDFYSIWPRSHLIALLFLAAIISVGIWVEAPKLRWKFTGAAIAFSVCGASYLFVGPVIIPEVEIMGSLYPGNGPTPPNGCDNAPIPPSPEGLLKVLIGNNAIGETGLGKFVALQVGTCPVLSLTRTADAIGLDAQLYDADGNLIATVTNDALSVLTGQNVTMSRKGDLSTLVVSDGSGKELLYVRFVNPTTVVARGVFGCPGHALVRVTDQQPVPGVFMSGDCFVNSKIGIEVQ